MSLAAIAVPVALAVLKVALVAGLGYLLTRRGVLHQAVLAGLSNLVIQVTAPCLNFANALNGSASASVPASLLLVMSAPVVLCLGYVGGAGLARLLGVTERSRRSVVAAATFQNASYLPLAVAAAVLPPLAGLFPVGGSSPAGIGGAAVVNISLFSVLYLPLFWGLGLWWLQGETDDGPRRLSWRVLLPPPVVGVLAGYGAALTPLRLLLTPPHAPLHSALLAVLDVGQLTIPLANLVLGGMLALALGGRHLRTRDVVAATMAKLALAPGVMLALLAITRRHWAHEPSLALAAFVVFLECATPPATNLAVMSRSKGLAGGTSEIIPGLLLVAYPLSLLTLPLWLTAFFRLLSLP
ncbi:MAG: AEC family transporter [Armatimonadetes bacterium]|nr:AEC family transporter [Armatimonadota bacterium]